jgi:RNA polymerase sigma-70 factor (ECF subfamily)
MTTLEPQKSLLDEALDSEAPQPLDALYRRYADWLSGALRRRFGPAIAAIAEDIVQETYIRAVPYQAAGGIRHPRAFLMRVASNITRDHLRRERRGQTASAAALIGAEATAEVHQTSEQMAALQLKQTILALPDPYRDVFVLSRFGGLTYDEIAHHCGLSVKTVEWRMKKALALCAQRLQD